MSISSTPTPPHNGRSLEAVVREQTQENLRVYATSPTRVDEDAGQEMNLAHGGYGRRQLLELVQNGADAMIPLPGGRIEVILTAEHLYCANDGDPVSEAGIRSLLHAHLSDKRGAVEHLPSDGQPPTLRSPPFR